MTKREQRAAIRRHIKTQRERDRRIKLWPNGLEAKIHETKQSISRLKDMEYVRTRRISNAGDIISMRERDLRNLERMFRAGQLFFSNQAWEADTRAMLEPQFFKIEEKHHGQWVKVWG